MKAIFVSAGGTLKVVDHHPIPNPGPNNIRVKLHAAGLNPADYKIAAKFSDIVLGLDGAGVVDSVGAGVTDLQVGDRVHYHSDLSKPFGTFAEYGITTAQTAIKIPDHVSFIDAAALPCAAWTAYQAIHRKLKIKRGQTILITGGSGAVGGFAVQLAHLAGLKVISTCSAAKKEFVLGLGASEVIDYKTEDIQQRVLQFTNGEKLDAWVDTVSPESATQGLYSLKFFGSLVFIAGAPKIEGCPVFENALSIHGIFLGRAHQNGNDAKNDLVAVGKEVLELFSQGKIKSLVSKVTTLEKIPEALQELKEGKVGGKIIAEIIRN